MGKAPISKMTHRYSSFLSETSDPPEIISFVSPEKGQDKFESTNDIYEMEDSAYFDQRESLVSDTGDVIMAPTSISESFGRRNNDSIVDLLITEFDEDEDE